MLHGQESPKEPKAGLSKLEFMLASLSFAAGPFTDLLVSWFFHLDFAPPPPALQGFGLF